jgi:hypothetical protein
MPNWCFTTYKFVGDTDEIADLYNKLQSLNDMPEPLVKNGFGKLFLGCVVNLFGGNWKEIYCRGAIEYMELCGDNMIQLSTYTAWGDMPEVWDFVCKNYPSIEYYYLAEESGMEYYINSDTTGEYFPEKYHIYCNEGYSEYANDDEELLDYIASMTGSDSLKDFVQLNTVLEQYNKEHPEEEIYYHKFELPKK